MYKYKAIRASSRAKEKLRIIKKKLEKQLRVNRDRELKDRADAVLLAVKLESVSEAARREGISRQTLAKWKTRLERSDYELSSLRDRSRRPKRRSAKKIFPYLEKKIKRMRKKMNLGALQIWMFLQQENISVSLSTIQHVLNGRRKPLPRAKKKRSTHKKRYELPIPGQRTQIDVKYGPMLANGTRPYVYVAIDECTRWRHARAYPQLNQFMTEHFLEQLQAKTPFPLQTLQTDNGFEFTFRLGNGDPAQHKMKTWCEERGIRHRLIPPGVKELNGKVERSHRIDDEHFYWRAPLHSLKAFNGSLAQWISFYNRKRPHYGLHGLTPLQKLEERMAYLPFEKIDEYSQPALKRFLPFLKFRPLNETQALLQELKARLTIYNDTVEGWR